jgi:vacuolar iron transporter family protein
MAAGEYVSVSSQRELLAASAPDEAAKASVPKLDIEANELALVYRARGMPADEAERHAEEVLQCGHVGMGTLESSVEGVEVVGSAITAAWTSFLSFGVGAVIPVLPFMFGLAGGVAVVVSAVLTGLALMATGGAVGVLSGGPPVLRALRQLAIGTLAAAATFVLGLGFGIALG